MKGYFSESYSEGREKFLNACAKAGLKVRSYVHPERKGHDGGVLATDCAFVGPLDAKRIILASCGTHGLEAAAGAATILQWLEEGGPSALPPGVAILFVHAVNPFGWAHASRGNEDGIDLNRNSIDFAAPPPENAAYSELHDLVVNADVTEAGLEAFTAAFFDFVQRKGLAHAIHGASAGQYVHPDGLSYGGATLSWSCETMQAIARAYLSQAELVLMIDWHTGIGPFGEPFFIIDVPKTEPGYALAASWWPEHAIHSDDILEDATPGYTGLLTVGLRNALARVSKAPFVGVVIEWGTYEVSAMLQALVMDNWLRTHRDLVGEPLFEDVRARLIERFYPSSPAWRESVLEQSRAIYAEAIAGVANWR